MGAFFLYDSNDTGNIAAVKTVFKKKGFQSPRCFELSNGYRLLNYQKQLIMEDNFLVDEKSRGIFIFGTCLYKALGYKQTIRSLLNDYLNNKVDETRLIGSYCIIFDCKDAVEFMIDPLYMYRVFVDQNQSRLSSSFLAVLSARKKKSSINRLALYEKLSSGYIIGPDTLVDGISQINRIAPHECLKHLPFHLRQTSDSAGIPSESCKCFEDCVVRQLNNLKTYFREIRALCDEYPVDLGLSGGYDSRLLLGIAASEKLPLHIHTHYQVGMHDKEGDVGIAQQLARLTGYKIDAHKTRNILSIPESEVKDILNDGLYYYDGRNSHNMGAFSETYTRTYKIKTLEDCRLSLNGLGGEIFRNYYFTATATTQTSQWMGLHIYYPNAWFALRDTNLRNDIKANVLRKIGAILDHNVTYRVNQVDIKRYYAEIRMPECDGINANAHNQVSFYLVPYIEWRIVNEAYAAIPFIGVTGDFQAAMIRLAAKKLAAVKSRYGFPFSGIPLKHRLIASLKGYTPPSLWKARNDFRIRYRSLGKRHHGDYKQWIRSHPTGQKIQAAFMDFVPNYDLSFATRDTAHRANVVFLGNFFMEFSHLLKN